MYGQATISETLKLLSYFTPPQYYHIFWDAKKNRPDSRILNTISAALTTGKPGDVYAVAFDKGEQLRLVFSKNGTATPEDKQAAKDLVNLVTNPAASLNDMYPYLFSRCWIRINKLLRKAHESSCEVLPLWKEALNHYPYSGNLTEELPGFQESALHQFQYGNGPLPSFPQIVDDLVQELIDLSSSEIPEDREFYWTAWIRYSSLAVDATVILRSKFLEHLVSHPTYGDTAKKFKKRIAKIRWYYHDINHLISRARFLTRDISICWADSVVTINEHVTLPEDYLESLRRNLPDGFPQTDEQIRDEVEKEVPEIAQKWAAGSSIQTCLHAEVRLILYFLQTTSSRNPQAFGCSKRSCVACTLWIGAYNRLFNAGWGTSRIGGKVDYTWAIPTFCHGNQQRRINYSVSRRLSGLLEIMLDDLWPDQVKGEDFCFSFPDY